MSKPHTSGIFIEFLVHKNYKNRLTHTSLMTQGIIDKDLYKGTYVITDNPYKGTDIALKSTIDLLPGVANI